MRPFPLRRLPRAERSRAPLWLWPAASGAAALAAALLLGRLRPEPGSVPARLWPGGTDAAVAMLQVVTTASVTAATLTFSLTLVALQLASQQFSPRLLRRFAHDRVIKSVLAVLTATFAFALTTLALLDGRRPLPAVALFLVAVSGVVSLAAVLAFLTHIVREVRVDNMLLAIHDETEDAIRLIYRTDGPASRSSNPPQDGRERGGTVHG
ncbi:MAG TPA: DUF2254 family protein, partial [Streptomyces sp.]|nr:DUF2254 family protein [Streptomyces sp.]